MSKEKLRAGLDGLIQSTTSSSKSSTFHKKPVKKNFNVWVEEGLHKRVKIRAIDLEMTITDYIVSLIKRDLGED